jgi:hypothetical protein
MALPADPPHQRFLDVLISQPKKYTTIDENGGNLNPATMTQWVVGPYIPKVLREGYPSSLLAHHRNTRWF